MSGSAGQEGGSLREMALTAVAGATGGSFDRRGHQCKSNKYCDGERFNLTNRNSTST